MKQRKTSSIFFTKKQTSSLTESVLLKKQIEKQEKTKPTIDSDFLLYLLLIGIFCLINIKDTQAQTVPICKEDTLLGSCIERPLLSIINTCTRGPNRSYNGTCNNLDNDNYGAAGIAFVREILPHQYGPTDVNNELNPRDGINPRAVSNDIFTQDNPVPNRRGLSNFAFTWGQFIDHDISLTPIDPDQPAHIQLDGDPDFSGNFNFFRSAIHPGTGENTGTPREHSNFITAWIDGSMIYGSDEDRANWLRTFNNGKLKTSSGNLPPFNTLTNERNGVVDPTAPSMSGDRGRNDAVPTREVFVMGDMRASSQAGLLSLQILFLREHNRICDELIAAGMTDDEDMYQRARKKVGAIIQCITYNEFLPIFGVQLDPFDGYDPGIQADLSNIFSTVGYRYAHTIIPDQTLISNNEETNQSFLTLGETHDNPNEVVLRGIDAFLKGAALQKMEEFDTKMVTDLRSFVIPNSGGQWFDLAAFDIQRGRDHGIPDYATMRAFYDTPISSFADITSDPDLQLALSNSYNGDINNVDAWVGMLAEDHLPNASIGITAHEMLKVQFTKLRDGDFYFYLNDPELSEADRAECESSLLSEVIKRNTDLTNIQRNVFRVVEEGVTTADECPSAIDLSEGFVGPTGTTNVMGFYDLQGTPGANDPAEPDCFSDNSTTLDLSAWFTFTVPTNGTYTIHTTSSRTDCGITNPLENGDTEIALYDGTNGCPTSTTGSIDYIACNEDVDENSDFTSQITINLLSGQIYYLLVDSWDGETGEFCFEITIEEPVDLNCNAGSVALAEPIGGCPTDYNIQLEATGFNVSATCNGGAMEYGWVVFDENDVQVSNLIPVTHFGNNPSDPNVLVAPASNLLIDVNGIVLSSGTYRIYGVSFCPTTGESCTSEDFVSVFIPDGCEVCNAGSVALAEPIGGCPNQYNIQLEATGFDPNVPCGSGTFEYGWVVFDLDGNQVSPIAPVTNFGNAPNDPNVFISPASQLLVDFNGDVLGSGAYQIFGVSICAETGEQCFSADFVDLFIPEACNCNAGLVDPNLQGQSGCVTEYDLVLGASDFNLSGDCGDGETLEYAWVATDESFNVVTRFVSVTEFGNAQDDPNVTISPASDFLQDLNGDVLPPGNYFVFGIARCPGATDFDFCSNTDSIAITLTDDCPNEGTCNPGDIDPNLSGQFACGDFYSLFLGAIDFDANTACDLPFLGVGGVSLGSGYNWVVTDGDNNELSPVFPVTDFGNTPDDPNVTISNPSNFFVDQNGDPLAEGTYFVHGVLSCDGDGDGVAESTCMTPNGIEVGFCGGLCSYAIENTELTCAEPGDNVCVWLNVVDDIDEDVTGLNFCLTYDPAILTPTGDVTLGDVVLNSGDLTQGEDAQVTINTDNSGIVLVVVSYTNAYFFQNIQSSVLCIDFTLNASLPTGSISDLTSCELIESRGPIGEEECVANGRIIGGEGELIRGQLVFWDQVDNSSKTINRNETPGGVTTIYGVDADGSNPSLLTTTPNDGGNGSFSYDMGNKERLVIERDITPDDFNTPSCDGLGESITGLDCAYIGWISARLTSGGAAAAFPNNGIPNAFQMLAADVTMDGRVLGGDITQVQRRIIGDLCEYQQAWNYTNEGNAVPSLTPYQRSLDWRFVDKRTVDTDSSYQPHPDYPNFGGSDSEPGYWRDSIPVVGRFLNACENGDCCTDNEVKNYYGILLGDVDGDWSNASVIPLGFDKTIWIGLGQAEELQSNQYRIPIYFTSSKEVYSLDLKMDYDETAIRIDTIQTTTKGLEDGFSMLYNNYQGEELRLTSYTVDGSQTIEPIYYMTVTVLSGEGLDEQYFYNPEEGEGISGDLGTFPRSSTAIEFTVVGVEEQQLAENQRQFQAYPNPTTDQLLVQLNETTVQQPTTLSIYNMQGQLVHQQQTRQINTTIDVAQMPSGIYLLQVEQDGQSIGYSKIVKQ